jgi:hypothetical protein
MESLAARGGLLRGARQSGGRLAGGEFNKATSEEVIELLEPELLEILEGSNVAYVLIDPPPVDGPIPGSLGLILQPQLAMEGSSSAAVVTAFGPHLVTSSPARPV